MIYKYSYGENRELLSEVNQIVTEYRNQVIKKNYDANQNMILSEVDYQIKGKVGCHYSTKYSYNKDGIMATKQSFLLDGDCPYLNEVKSVYSYDSNGNIKNIKSELDGEDGAGYTTFKVKKIYTNEFDY